MTFDMLNRARDLRHRVRAQASAKSPDPLGAFFISGHCVGRLTPDVMRALSDDPMLTREVRSVGRNGFALRDDATPESRALALDRLTDRFEALGMTQPRRHERLDIRDEDGKILATAERAVFRTLGLPTMVVRLLGVTPEGDYWLQRRSLTKAVGPGLWDNLAAGMIAAGEDPLSAALRELHEEAGLRLRPDELIPMPGLSPCFERRVPMGWLDEGTACFRMTVPSETIPVNLDGEADAFERLTPERLLDAIEADRLMPEAALLLVEALIVAGE